MWHTKRVRDDFSHAMSSLMQTTTEQHNDAQGQRDPHYVDVGLVFQIVLCFGKLICG